MVQTSLLFHAPDNFSSMFGYNAINCAIHKSVEHIVEVVVCCCCRRATDATDTDDDEHDDRTDSTMYK